MAFCRKEDRPELVWSCFYYADTPLQRDRPGDRQKAMLLLDEILNIPPGHAASDGEGFGDGKF